MADLIAVTRIAALRRHQAIGAGGTCRPRQSMNETDKRELKALIDAEVNSRRAIERREILVEIERLKARGTKQEAGTIELVMVLIRTRSIAR